MSTKHSPNDQRSIVKNPNNPAYAHDAANRAAQGHPTPAAPPTAPEAPPPTTPKKS